MENNDKYDGELAELTTALVETQRRRWTALRSRYWEWDFKQAVKSAFLRGYTLAKMESGK